MKNMYVVLAALAVVCLAKDPAKPVPSNNFSASISVNSTTGGFNEFIRLFYDSDNQRVRLDNYLGTTGVVEAQSYYLYRENVTYSLYVPENSCDSSSMSDPWIKAWNILADATYVGEHQWAGKPCEAWMTIDNTLGSNVISCWNGNVPLAVQVDKMFLLDVLSYRPSVKDSDFALPSSCNAV